MEIFMSFQEFPKALYRGEEFTTVDSADAEVEHRKQGWHDYGDQPATPANKPKTTKQPATPANEA